MPPPAELAGAVKAKSMASYEKKENSVSLCLCGEIEKDQPRKAMTSISMRASFGSFAAWMVERAGWGAVKNVA